MPREAPRGRATFIVRLSRDRHGRFLGIVERVKTGRKERCAGLAGIGEVIERMLGVDGDGGSPRRQAPSRGARGRLACGQ